jgi:hypothetical protein
MRNTKVEESLPFLHFANVAYRAVNSSMAMALMGYFLPATSVRLLAIQFFESDGSKNLEAAPHLARINCHF